jgi:DNA-binding MarR family transcriptional regulator
MVSAAMASEVKKEIALEIAHVLFIEFVGYSKLSVNDQHASVASQQKYSDEDIFKPLGIGGMTTTLWQKDLAKGLGLSSSGFHDRRRKLEEKGLIRKEGAKWLKVSK